MSTSTVVSPTSGERFAPGPVKRAAYATAFAACVTAAFLVGGVGDPLVWGGLLLPDLALLVSPSVITTGVLDRRAVRAYNLAHHPLFAAVLAIAVPPAGLAWLGHIAMDRTVGYGPRSADGSQRGY